MMEDIRQTLLAMQQRAYEDTLAFFASLGEEALQDSGLADEWGPKDVLAHIVEWAAITSHRLSAARHGETPASYADIDAKNDEIFQQYRSLSSLDIQVHADEINQDLRRQLQSFPLADLLDPDRYPWLSGQPLYWRIAHSLYFHPNFHIALLELKHTGRQPADVRMQRTIADLLALDESPRWQGLYLYNLACYYAVPGDLDRVFDCLRQAFSRRSELIEWSKSDARLAAVHADPRYHSLVYG
jgi:hypothetical protein